MIPSIFATLCDVADALDRSIRDLPAGPERDTLEDLGRRHCQVVDPTSQGHSVFGGVIDRKLQQRDKAF